MLSRLSIFTLEDGRLAERKICRESLTLSLVFFCMRKSNEHHDNTSRPRSAATLCSFLGLSHITSTSILHSHQRCKRLSLLPGLPYSNNQYIATTCTLPPTTSLRVLHSVVALERQNAQIESIHSHFAASLTAWPGVLCRLIKHISPFFYLTDEDKPRIFLASFGLWDIAV